MRLEGGGGLGWPGMEYEFICDLMRFSASSVYNYWEYNALGRLPEKIPRFQGWPRSFPSSRNPDGPGLECFPRSCHGN